MTEHRSRIATVLNQISAENGSNTPDWILAEYLLACLAAFDSTVKLREWWYGWQMAPGQEHPRRLSAAKTNGPRPAMRTRTSEPAPGDPPVTDTVEDVLNAMGAELDRQTELWGEQNHPDGTGPDLQMLGVRAGILEQWAKNNVKGAVHRANLTWILILAEEFFEAAAEADPARLQVELIQVAAVAIRWADAIARRTADQSEEQRTIRDPRYIRKSSPFQYKGKKLYDGMTDG